MVVNNIIPPHLKYLSNTFENRFDLENLLGPAKITSGDVSYLEVNTVEKSWRVSFSFEWLYRTQPSLITFEELEDELEIRTTK